VSAETVLRWTRRGELPAIRLPGGAIRYREDDLNGWLEERATGASRYPGRTGVPRALHHWQTVTDLVLQSAPRRRANGHRGADHRR
jgi:excisionase family DNA binding protein